MNNNLNPSSAQLMSPQSETAVAAQCKGSLLVFKHAIGAKGDMLTLTELALRLAQSVCTKMTPAKNLLSKMTSSINQPKHVSPKEC